MLLVTFCNALLKKSAFVGIVALAVFLLPQPALGQFTTASLSGIVRDSSAAGIPDATVNVLNVGTGFTQEVVTGANGAFLFSRLPIGTYVLRIEKQGFSAYVQDQIALNVDQSANLAAHNSADRAGHRRSDCDRHSGADHDANGDRNPDSRRAADCGAPSPGTEAGAADVSGGRDRGPGTQRLHYLRPGRLLPRRRDGGRERRGAGPGEFPARCHQP